MKKHNLFKVISLMFLSLIVLTWIIPVGTYSNGIFIKDKINPIGLFDLFRIPLMTIINFLQYGILIILIGSFYGVLNKTGSYSHLIETIIKKLKGKERIFLIINIIILTILNSIIGLPYAFLIIIPFLMTIILKLGFNKLTALISTIGSLLLGNIVSIYGSNIALSINSNLNLSLNSEVFTKIIFLCISIFLLIVFVLKETKNIKNTKKEEVPLYEENNKKRNFIPLIVIFLISFIFILINMYNWNSVNVTHISETYQNIFSNKIVSNIFGTVSIFGTWSIYDMCIVLLFVILIIGWVYSVKLDDIIDGMIKGAKEVLKVALYAVIVNIIFTSLYYLQTNSNIFYTITNFIFNLCGELKTLATILISILGSFFYNDISTLITVLARPIENIITDTTIYQVIGIIIQGVHGILMFILPTSILLVVGLSYLNISYKQWFKYIWKFLIQIMIITSAITLITSYFTL